MLALYKFNCLLYKKNIKFISTHLIQNIASSLFRFDYATKVSDIWLEFKELVPNVSG